MLLLISGQLSWAQVDPNQKLNYKPWVVVNKMDNRAGDMSGKLFALEESSIVLINPVTPGPMNLWVILISNQQEIF
jgi:hypothetical protein